jgi:putative membrane protein
MPAKSSDEAQSLAHGLRLSPPTNFTLEIPMRPSLTRTGTRTIAIAALAAGSLLAGCKSERGTPADTTAAGEVARPATDTTTMPATNPATPAASTIPDNKGWTDGQIIAFAVAANQGEIAQGRLAETKATSPAVKAFARQMVSDHRMMLKDVESFAKKQSIVADTTKSDVTDLMKGANDGLNDLTTKAASTDWDKNYMDKQISAHKTVLDKLQDAEKSTTNPALKDMLNKAVGKVQSHLTKAQDVKDNQIKA